MKLKDFLKDRLIQIVVHFSCISVTILIMYLTFAINSKRFPVENIVYALLLSAIIYATFLVYEYYRNNSFYKQIHKMLQAEGNFNYLLNAEDAKTSDQKAYIELLTK